MIDERTVDTSMKNDLQSSIHNSIKTRLKKERMCGKDKSIIIFEPKKTGE